MKLLILAALFSSLSALACPQLEGHYKCPANQNQGEVIFKLSRTENNGIHQYLFTYVGYPEAKTNASISGVLNVDEWYNSWAYCMNEELIYFKVDSTDGWIQQSYLDQGDFVAKVRGKEVIRCAPITAAESGL